MENMDKIIGQIRNIVGDLKIDVAVILGSGWNECLKKVKILYCKNGN